jgi:hypothetical protein
MTRTDAELLIASREDPRAFRELYDRWADRLLAYFYRRVVDAEVAGDLLAETFAVAFERRRRFRDVGAPGAAWLYGRVLDRLGWAGWRIEVRDDLGSGPCGTALGYNGDGSRSIEGSMLADERRLIVTPGPRRSTLDLIDGPGVRVMEASAERCYTVDGIERLVRDQLPAGGRTLRFTTGSRPAGTGIVGARGKRLDEGCAIIVGFMPTPDDRGIVVEIWR